MSKFHFILLLTLIAFSIVACTKDADNYKSLADSRALLNKAQSLSYNYTSVWDNRFNKTTFKDSTLMIISRLENLTMMYGVHAMSRGDEYIFAGDTYLEILHNEKKILNHDLQTINQHPKDVLSGTFLMHMPLDILDMDSLHYVRDTILDHIPYAQYRSTTSRPSMSDSAILMTYHTDHFIDVDSLQYNRVVATSIKGVDTLQVITSKFENLVLSEATYSFDMLDRIKNLGYKLTTQREEDADREFKRIHVGEQLTHQSFVNIDGLDVAITKPNKTTIVMFSFMGCGGCEIALKKMERKEFDFEKNINFYYSSPVDRGEVLKEYLKNKNYYFPAFGKESKMNDQFSISSYPTFVVLDDQGIVQKIEWDYDEIIDDYMQSN